MGIETEIKCEVAPADLEKLAASRSLRPSDGELVTHRDLVSTYFDTPKHVLRRNGISLRVRQAGKKHIQTVKTATNGVALGRGEWEQRIANSQPDQRAAHDTPLQQQLSNKHRRKLDAGLPDGVHQMRVGVRRLRAAIWVFSDLLQCQQTEAIKQDLKWLAGKLGPVRDLDVFLDTKVKRLAEAEPPIAGLADLVGELDY